MVARSHRTISELLQDRICSHHSFACYIDRKDDIDMKSPFIDSNTPSRSIRKLQAPLQSIRAVFIQRGYSSTSCFLRRFRLRSPLLGSGVPAVVLHELSRVPANIGTSKSEPEKSPKTFSLILT